MSTRPHGARRYAKALEQLYALQARGIRLGATRMQAALALRGHPERGQVFVHVAGTNGKGSVSAMIAACLRAAGLRTGLFTSPHLHRYVERVRIDGKPITEREAAQRIEELLEFFDATPSEAAPEITFFELTTLLAIEAFAAHRCDVVVLEVGLGGRLDATNAVPTAVSVITRVARDHTQVLGETPRAIAKEKAGIAKRATPLVLGVRDGSARRVIEAHARRVGAPVHRIDAAFGAELEPERASLTLHALGRRVPRVVLGLPGAYQLDNVACAFGALELLARRLPQLAVSDAAVRRGLSAVRWPARLETLPRVARQPCVLLDAAHNEDGCAALAGHLECADPWLRERERQTKRGGRAPARVLVFGALADKDFGPMLARLVPLVDHVLLCAPNVSRAASARDLTRIAPRAELAKDVRAALARARKLAGPRGEVVVAGSIFLVAEARARLLGVRSDPPIRM
jgi:dihydrofolate synthase/folylpolyglutamate synthase